MSGAEPKLDDRMRRDILLAVLSLTIAVTIGQSQTEPLHVSLIQLIANPEKYDGKQVAVVGFLRLEFEGNALYLFAGRLSPPDNKECNLDRRYARHRQGRPSS